jgi:hypothetical protein
MNIIEQLEVELDNCNFRKGEITTILQAVEKVLRTRVPPARYIQFETDSQVDTVFFRTQVAQTIYVYEDNNWTKEHISTLNNYTPCKGVHAMYSGYDPSKHMPEQYVLS